MTSNHVPFKDMTAEEQRDICMAIPTNPPEPMHVPWDQIDRRFNYAAADENGRAWLCTAEPQERLNSWGSGNGWMTRLDGLFADFRRGTVPWDESLTTRPGYDGE